MTQHGRPQSELLVFINKVSCPYQHSLHHSENTDAKSSMETFRKRAKLAQGTILVRACTQSQIPLNFSLRTLQAHYCSPSPANLRWFQPQYTRPVLTPAIHTVNRTCCKLAPSSERPIWRLSPVFKLSVASRRTPVRSVRPQKSLPGPQTPPQAPPPSRPPVLPLAPPYKARGRSPRDYVSPAPASLWSQG